MKVNRVERDFYGGEVMTCARGAASVLNDRGDLVREWSDAGGIARGYARWIVNQAFEGGPKERGLAEEIAEFAMAWVMRGLPRLLFSHKLAASLAETNIGEEFCNEVRAPWDFFIVVIPERVLHNNVQSSILVRTVTINDEMGQTGVGVSIPRGEVKGEPGCRILYQHWSSPELLKRGHSPVASMKACASWREYAKPATSLPKHGEAELTRSLEWHMRLIFGACVELQGDERIVAKGAHRGSYDPAPGRGDPKVWNLMLARNVMVDMRAHSRDFISGDRKSLGKQGIVRGHWKRQPCGQDSKQRKLIHVEPYWRGPDDAPIAVRSHILKGGASDAGA